MKKIIITAGVFACAVAIASAQTVTSANIVGYTKVVASDSALSLVAVNFIPASSNVNDLIGAQLPVNSKLHIWNKSSGAYNTVTYSTTRAGTSWPASATLNLGDAFWIEVAPGGGSNEVIMAGEVLGDDLSTTIGGPIDATGYFYPVSTTWGDTDLAAVLPADSKLHLWDGSAYTTYTKTTTRAGTDWSVEAKARVINPADGFWVEAPSTAWTEVVPY